MSDESLLTRTLSLSSYGDDVYGVKRTVYSGLDSRDGGRRLHELERKTPRVKRLFGPFFRSDVQRMQRMLAFKETGKVDEALWHSMLRRGYSDARAIQLINQYIDEHKKPPAPKVPNLGPIVAGGASVLAHDLTHETDGIALYPAFDDAFYQGANIIAPEALTVQRTSSSNPGHAFYAIGASTIQYWFAHLDRTHYPGLRFGKGQLLGRVGPNHVGGGPHCHVGVNVEILWGRGRQLAHHTNYTHGSPTIGAQLAAAVE